METKRPDEVTKLAKAIFDYPKSHPNLLSEIQRAGFAFESEHPMSGVWWVKMGEIEVMINFGGPRKVARAWSWRLRGGPTEKI